MGSDPPLYAVVETKINEAVAATGDFYGHAQQYDELVEADAAMQERAREKVVEHWIAAESARRDIDWLIDEIGIDLTLRVEEEGGETYEDTVTANTLQQLLHCSHEDLSNMERTDPDRLSGEEAGYVIAALWETYDELANMNRQYLEALDTLAAHETVVDEKRGETTYGDSVVEQEYAEIEAVLAERRQGSVV